MWLTQACNCVADRSTGGFDNRRDTWHAIERLHQEFKRRIKTQTVLPSANAAAMLFWALLASGQIIMRKVEGWADPFTKTICSDR